MARYLSQLLICIFVCSFANAFAKEQETFRAFAIKAPRPDSVDRFSNFIRTELSARGVNTLILRVDYAFEFKSHPELLDNNALSVEDAQQLLKVCREEGIELIPQINLLGHQSWHSSLGKLLTVYTEFDETPHVKLPEEYKWPNEDGLYCKSYCPLHPNVHEVVFALVDEVMDAFEASKFHAGMDEVFFIGDEKCPRCAGKNKAKLFADEVFKIRSHLKENDQELWIWGDRLIDGELTGMGIWEASGNGTHPAIDMIPKDVVICDWHYVRADPTAAYFAMKGFQVITCAWNQAEVATQQHKDMLSFKAHSTPTLADRYPGMMQTIWSPAESFMDAMKGPLEEDDKRRGQVDCFRALADAWQE